MFLWERVIKKKTRKKSMIELSLWLYGKPSWEMDIEGKKSIDVNMLREQGTYLKEHLETTAAIIERLQKDGWAMLEVYGEVYELVFYKEAIRTQEEAILKLQQLGIDMRCVDLREFCDEEEWAS